MYQADRGNYKKTDSLSYQFTHSCLGRTVIFGGIVAVLMIIASITVPGEKKMKDEMVDNIRQCIAANDSTNVDEIDEFFNNIAFIFTNAKKKVDTETMGIFNRLNTLQYYKHGLYSTMYVTNTIHPMGERIGLGIYGVVIPTISIKDLLLTVAPIHEGYNKVINTIPNDDFDLGENPHLKPYHYKGDPEN